MERVVMKVKLEKKKCSWCETEYQGRSYQEFCGVSCSDKSYYWRKKKGLKREIPKIKCDVCGVFFQPIRINTKRCSSVCRSKWVRNFSQERYKVITEKRSKTINCAVCFREFKATASRKTCSKKCSQIYSSYSPQKRKVKQTRFEELYGRPYKVRVIPLPSHKPIPVGEVDVSSSQDLESAVEMFLKGGGKIRRYKASVETDLLEGHPLKIDELNESDVQEQLFGTVKAK